MTNAEILQKYLPCHTTYGDFDLCVECPYNPHPGKIWEYGCAHGQDKMIDDAIALLEEQEAIPADTKAIGTYNGDIEVYCCRDCRTILDPAFHYCPNCGKAVKWNE